MIPLSFLSAIPWRMVAIVVFVAATFFAGLITGREQVQDKWDTAKAEQVTAALTAEQEHRKAEQSMQQKFNEATNDAIEREKKLRADYDAVHVASLGLRDTIATLRGRMPKAPAETCRLTADAALAIFGECSSALGDLAAKADRHASDTETCRAAWPE
jgi:hypothetical protein